MEDYRCDYGFCFDREKKDEFTEIFLDFSGDLLFALEYRFAVCCGQIMIDDHENFATERSATFSEYLFLYDAPGIHTLHFTATREWKQVYVILSGEECAMSLSLAMEDHLWQTVFNLILFGFRVN